MSNLYEAKKLKNDFPKETEGFSVFEIEKIWSEHSEMVSASWLIPTDNEEVERVFDYFR